MSSAFRPSSLSPRLFSSLRRPSAFTSAHSGPRAFRCFSAAASLSAFSASVSRLMRSIFFPESSRPRFFSSWRRPSAFMSPYSGFSLASFFCIFSLASASRALDSLSISSAFLPASLLPRFLSSSRSSGVFMSAYSGPIDRRCFCAMSLASSASALAIRSISSAFLPESSRPRFLSSLRSSGAFISAYSTPAVSRCLRALSLASFSASTSASSLLSILTSAFDAIRRSTNSSLLPLVSRSSFLSAFLRWSLLIA